jgi:glycosyltransferase involved in cell wall biosynthesis
MQPPSIATGPAISAVILTLNEQQHLGRCLASLAGHCREILIVDSGSSDGTKRIAEAAGARFISHAWANYAKQFNYGISQVSESCEWVLRIDADEYLEEGWYERFSSHLHKHPHVCGIALKRTMVFKGKPIRFGLAQTWQLRLFRRALGACESRWMDEHIIVDGAVNHLNVQITDHNLNDIRWWSQKHLAYADREAADLLLQTTRLRSANLGMSLQARTKRWLKNNLYRRLPITVRAAMFFIVRFLFCGGFLDGRRGFQFHFLQGWWYRMYTDLRVEEIQDRAREYKGDVREAIRQVTGLQIEND